MEVLGLMGSCAWTTSGENARVTLRTWRHECTEQQIGTTDPL
jgi:hypothetical protein